MPLLHFINILLNTTLWNAELPPLSCIQDVIAKHFQHKSVQICGEINKISATEIFLMEIMKNRTIYIVSEPGSQLVHTDLIFLPPIANIPYGINTYNRRAIILTDHLLGADNIFRKSQLLNAVLLHQSKAYTWYPYDPDQCWQDSVAIQPVAECDDFTTGNLYPDKIPSNMQKCPFRVLQFGAIPFSMVTYDLCDIIPPPENIILQAILDYFNMEIYNADEDELVEINEGTAGFHKHRESLHTKRLEENNTARTSRKCERKGNMDIANEASIYNILSNNTEQTNYTFSIKDLNFIAALHNITKAIENGEIDKDDESDIVIRILDAAMISYRAKSEYFNSDGRPIEVGELLIQQVIDMNLQGASFDPSYSGKFEFTPSYAEDSLVWFVPTSRKVDPVHGLYTEFPPSIWAMFLLAYCSFTAVLYWASSRHEGRKVHECAFIAFALIFGQNSKTPTKGFRIMEGLFLMYILHIVFFYCNALLANILIDPMEKPIESAEEALHKGLTPLIRQSGLEVLMEMEPNLFEEMHGNYKLMNSIPVRCLVRKKCIILAELLRDRIFIKVTTEWNRNIFFQVIANILEPPLAKYRKVMYMSPGNPLAPKVNRVVQCIIEAGIPQHSLKILQPKIENSFNIIDKNEQPILLSLTRLQSAFYLYAGAIISSVIIFIAEISVCKVNRKNNSGKYFNIKLWKYKILAFYTAFKEARRAAQSVGEKDTPTRIN